MRVAILLGGALILLGCTGILGGDTAADGTGGGIEQDAACADYLDCLSEVDAGTFASLQGTYGTGGTCWTDAATADACATACQSGLSEAHDAWPDESACDDGSPPTASDYEGTWEFANDGPEMCAGYGEIEMDMLTLALSASSDTEFELGGTVGLSLIEFGWQEEVDVDTFSCTLEDGDFECETYAADYDLLFDFEGGVDPMEGTFGVGLGDGNGDILCTAEFDVTGERQ